MHLASTRPSICTIILFNSPIATVWFLARISQKPYYSHQNCDLLSIATYDLLYSYAGIHIRLALAYLYNWPLQSSVDFQFSQCYCYVDVFLFNVANCLHCTHVILVIMVNVLLVKSSFVISYF